MNRNKYNNYRSCIAATLHISETEVVALEPNYNYLWSIKHKGLLEQALWKLGLDTSMHYELQGPCQHRNRMGNTVTCHRYYGSERIDTEWLNSGFASTAAKDKAKNSPLLDDLYAMRGETVYAQEFLEKRDADRAPKEENEGY